MQFLRALQKAIPRLYYKNIFIETDRFQVHGSKVTTDGYGKPYWPRVGLPDIPDKVKRFYKHHEAEIIPYELFKEFSTQNVEP